MTAETLLAEIKQRKLFVSNLYEATDKTWRCFLRKKRNDLPSHYRGIGATMSEALWGALVDAKAADDITIEDLLGD